MLGKLLAANAGFVDPQGLNLRTCGAVQNKDSFFEKGIKLLSGV